MYVSGIATLEILFIYVENDIRLGELEMTANSCLHFSTTM